jgi:hypothetical protein
MHWPVACTASWAMRDLRARTLKTECVIAALFSMLLAATPATAQTVTAMWDPSPPSDQVTTYQVCVGTSSSSCDVVSVNVSAASTSYTFIPVAGVRNYVAIRAGNSAGWSPYTAAVSFSIPSFAQPANQTGTSGVAITPVNLSISDPDGSPLTFTHTGLPLGLSINSATRQIVGTPTAPGNYSVTVFVNDGLVTVSRSFGWTISGPDLTAPFLSISSHTAGQTLTTSSVTLTGTATDAGAGGNGVNLVTVNGQTVSGTASGNGTVNWSRTLTMAIGVNPITVTARDTLNNTVSLTINLDYRPWAASGTALTPDVNGDRRTDLLIQDTSNRFWLSLASTSGYSTPTVVLQHGGAYNPDGAHIADVNGDGREDLLMQGFDNRFWLSLSTGSGLASPVLVLSHGGPFNPTGAHIGDVNGDGRDDVLMQSFDNSFWLSLSTGTGFTPPVKALQHGGPFNPDGAHMADVDGDGKADVLMQGVDNRFWLSLSTGSGFTLPTLVLQHGGPFNPMGAHVADVNGDGRADVLMQGVDNRFWLSLSTGSSYGPATMVLQHGGAFNPYGAHIADLNGDGRADVLMQGVDNRFWLSTSTGAGYSTPTMVLQHGGPFNPLGAHVVDVNADGRADVLMEGFDHRFWISISNGSGFASVTQGF